MGIIQLLFLLPYIIVRAIYVIFSNLVLNKKINADDMGEKKWSYLVSGIAWFVLGGWLIFQNQFINITYVYACPSTGTSKCYKVRADYIPKDCEDTEWDMRGAHGGRCTDPYIGKIYFENGGYVSFEYCDMESKNKWTCYAEDKDDGTWNLQMSEVVKVKK